MESYFLSFKVALILFPLIAFVFTLPYIIYQYHKYGSIPFFRSFLVYLFILYLLVMYLLIILPLPSISDVQAMTSPTMQLIPFHFIVDFIQNTNFSITNIHTYIPTLLSAEVYTVLFNLLLFVPFGFFLRYYFKCSLKKTFFLSLVLSLFFELTQLSGLYFIYPRPYRLFDVDDLMINTLGGLFGYAIVPLFSFLPTRDEIDKKSYLKGKTITPLRRFTAFFIDSFIVSILTIIFGILSQKYAYFIVLILYFIILPYFTKGQTFGKFLVQIRIVHDDGSKVTFKDLVIRQGLLYFVFLSFPIYSGWLLSRIGTFNPLLIIFLVLLIMICMFYYFRLLFQAIRFIFTGKDKFTYEMYSHTKEISNIMESEKKE